jgi:hypothetical protein
MVSSLFVGLRVDRKAVHRTLFLHLSVWEVVLEEMRDIPKVSSLQASQFDGSPEQTASPFLITLSNFQKVFFGPVSTPLDLDFSRRDNGTAADTLGGGGESSSQRQIAKEGQTSHFPFADFAGIGSSLTIRHRHSAGFWQRPQSE